MSSGTIPFFPKSITNTFVNTTNQVFNQIITATGGIVIKSLTVTGNANIIGTSINNNNLSVNGPVTINGNLTINGTLNLAGQSITPIPSGTIMPYPSLNVPTGWILCDGSNYLQTEYPNLFAAIGTIYGAGLPGTFNVPDLRGRVTAGANLNTNVLPSNYRLGETGGIESVILSISQTPSHIHLGSTDPNQGLHSHIWSASGTTPSSGAHSHTTQGTISTNHSHKIDYATVKGKRSAAAGSIDFPLTGGSALVNPVGSVSNLADTIYNTPPAIANGSTSGGSHDHSWSTASGITTNEAGHTHNISSVSHVGGSDAHNNLQPYLVLNYIIKT
jgi:microcystin-dependent protein